MRKFWSVLAVELGKRAGLVSVVTLIMTLGLGYGVTKLQFATGQDSYLNKDDQIAIDNEEYQSLFGGQIIITLFTLEDGATLEDLVVGENRQTMLEVAAELEKVPSIQSVVTPLDGLQFSHNLITRSFDEPTVQPSVFNPLTSIASTTLDYAKQKDPSEARTEDFAKTTERITPFLGQEMPKVEDPEWASFLLRGNDGKVRKSLQTFFPDENHAQMIVQLKGNADIETEGAGAVATKAAWEGRDIEGAKELVVGAPFLLKDLNDYLRGGILQLGAIAIAIMVVILLVAFDVRWRLLPLVVVLIGVTWAFGLAGYLGIPLSVVTIAGLPVMLGVGIDYAIQMHARVEEEVIVDRAEHPIQETSRNLGPALLVVTFDALFAFAALYWAKVPMIRSFALLLSIGVAVICLCSIFLPLALLGIREYRSPTTGRDFREGYLGRFVVWLGSLPPKVAPAFIVGGVLVFVGGALVESKLELQTDPVQWVNQSSQTRKDIATLEEEVDTSSAMGIYVRGDSTEALFTDEDITFVDNMTEDTLKEFGNELLRGSSIVTPLSYLVEIPGAEKVTPTGEQVWAAYQAAPEVVQKLTVADEADNHALNVLYITKPGPLDTRVDMVHSLRTNLDPPENISATPSGLLVVGVGLLENLEANRVELTYLAIFLVFAFLTVRLKSVVRSLLSLVPVVIAVGAASLIAYIFDLKLSPMTAVGGPLVIAVCTEFTSLIILRFLEERERGLAPQAAADVTAARTGRAFMVSAMTAVVGVAVIATSSLPLLRDFGIIVAMNVVVALVCALVVLPPLMVWAENRGWVSKGMIDPEILAQANRTADDPLGHGPGHRTAADETAPAT